MSRLCDALLQLLQIGIGDVLAGLDTPEIQAAELLATLLVLLLDPDHILVASLGLAVFDAEHCVVLGDLLCFLLQHLLRCQIPSPVRLKVLLEQAHTCLQGLHLSNHLLLLFVSARVQCVCFAALRVPFFGDGLLLHFPLAFDLQLGLFASLLSPHIQSRLRLLLFIHLAGHLRLFGRCTFLGKLLKFAEAFLHLVPLQDLAEGVLHAALPLLLLLNLGVQVSHHRFQLRLPGRHIARRVLLVQQDSLLLRQRLKVVRYAAVQFHGLALRIGTALPVDGGLVCLSCPVTVQMLLLPSLLSPHVEPNLAVKLVSFLLLGIHALGLLN
mmetsp:Transcript_11851/g.21686  ORF Transcript_11851/g.21686 Transcript_11851/m.21686 type:complete len:326 (-) Transcript_11851:238-1215(-)